MFILNKNCCDLCWIFFATEYEATFTHLSNEEVTAAYNCTSRRAIFLDFNGTIVIKEPPGKYLKREILGTSGLKPPSSVSHNVSFSIF